MALYVDAQSSVSAAGGTSAPFEMTVWMHQDSALNPLLFNLVMDEATKEYSRGIPWDALYVNYLVLTA